MTKPVKRPVRPAKTQISLGIRPVWSESSLSAWRKFGSLATHWAHSEDSDQTGRMPRLIWVFAGRRNHFGGFVKRWLKFHSQKFTEHMMVIPLNIFYCKTGVLWSTRFYHVAVEIGGWVARTPLKVIVKCVFEIRAGVYETLCPQHMLASTDNLERICKGQKRVIIQSHIYRNLPNINQVIYTIDTICVPNIMILPQMLLQIFCWQGSIGLQCMSE